MRYGLWNIDPEASTPEQIERNRRLFEVLMRPGQVRYAGEGLTKGIAAAIGGFGIGRDNRIEREGRSAFMDALMGRVGGEMDATASSMTAPVGSYSGGTGGSRSATRSDSAAVAGIALDSAAPTAGLPYMLPSEDPDMNDPRRGQFATPAPRVDDPNVFTTDVTGNTAGVNPELLRNLGNSAEQAFGPGGVVTVSSGRRHGSPGGSDHNSGEAADFNMAPFGQDVPVSTDPRYFDMARVAAADPYPVRAVGIGDDYMGHAYNHFGTGEGQNIPNARTWSDWNTGANLARYGRNSADAGGAGDPNYQFAGELQNILNNGRVPLGGGAPGSMLAQAPQMETTASSRAPSGGVAEQVRNGLVSRFTGQLGVDPQRAEMLADAFLINMEDESGLVPDMVERVPNVHGTRGRGLYQLTGSRRDAYERIYGDDYSIDNQLDFLVSELQGPESRAWNAISSAGNTGEAAAAITTDFLRPAAQHRDRRVAEYLGGRTPNLEATASARNPSAQPPQSGGTPRPSQPAFTNADLDQLYTLAMNPWATPAERQVLMGMINQQVQANDPMRQAQLELAQLQLEQARNPQPDQTALMQNVEWLMSQGMPFEQALQSARSGQSINVNTGGGTNFGQDWFEEQYGTIQTQAAQAANTIGLYDMAESALDSLGDNTGFGAEAQQSLRQIGARLGMDVDLEALAGGELLTAVTNRMALQMRNPDSGMGMPGAVSDRDLTFLRDAQVGIDRSPEGNRRMLRAFRAMEERKIEIAQMADRYISQNGGLDIGFNEMVRQYAEANPMFSPEMFNDIDPTNSGNTGGTGGDTGSQVDPANPTPITPGELTPDDLLYLGR
jgi:hypothetical protein